MKPHTHTFFPILIVLFVLISVVVGSYILFSTQYEQASVDLLYQP